MVKLKAHNIDVYHLKEGKHLFGYELGKQFFSLFPEDILNTGAGTVKVEIDKSSRLFNINFDFDLTVTLTCDRSLEPFDFAMKMQREWFIKYGDEDQDIDERMSVISEGTQEINLTQAMFDFIGLEVPMKKLHPKYEDEDEDGTWVFKAEEEADENNEKPSVWDKLKDLKNNKN